MTTGSFFGSSQSKMGVPRGNAPTVEPIVAVPIAIVSDTLMPARIADVASGSSRRAAA